MEVYNSSFLKKEKTKGRYTISYSYPSKFTFEFQLPIKNSN